MAHGAPASRNRVFGSCTSLQPRSFLQKTRGLPIRTQPGVSGSFRRPTESDRDLLVRWVDAFAAEALGPIERLDAADWVDRYYATPSRGGYLWEDGGIPVSFAAYGNPTAHGIRIGPVYTPPEHRGWGYASACVATLSQHLLESGRSFCYLFTDLANPTSNAIYQKIGYNPVNDVDVYEFEMER